MTVTNADVAAVIRDAATYMDEHGMCRNAFRNEKGEVCARGALRAASFGAPGALMPIDSRESLLNAVAGYQLMQHAREMFGAEGIVDYNDHLCPDKETMVKFMGQVADKVEVS